MMMIPDDLQRELFPLMTLIVAVMGCCIGSFLNVVIWRLPRGESLVSPGSHCPKCGHAIAAWQNIPLLSWLVLRGRCFSCRAPISVRYPLIEMLTGLLFLGVWAAVYQAALPWGCLPVHFFLVSALFASAIADAETGLIPNAITYTGLAVALVAALALPAAVYYPGGERPLAAEETFSVFLGGLALLLPEGTLLPGDRAYAVAHCLFGVVVGAGFLLAVRQVGHWLWRRRRTRFATPTALRFRDGHLQIGDGADDALADLFRAGTDSLRFAAHRVRIRRHAGAEVVLSAGDGAAVELLFLPDQITAGEHAFTPEEIADLSADVTEVEQQREVLGLGDVKLMAMIGAFLGPDACVYILLIAALAGSMVGGALILIRPRQGRSFAFGPFLAGAAAVWFFFGNHLVLWYGNVILAFHCSARPL